MNYIELLSYGSFKLIEKNIEDNSKYLLDRLLELNDNELTEELINNYKLGINKLIDGKPIQYIIGSVNFYGREFMVNKNVLIPRSETEGLVEKSIELIKKYFSNDINILDIGTGSGVIGITLQKELPGVAVTALDISNKALEVADINARQNDATIEFIQSNVFSNLDDNKFDVIISNPPYISINEEVMDIVKQNEPEIALYADDNGLAIYKNIIDNASEYLKNKYLIGFEIGATQKEDIENYINQKLEDVEIFSMKDLQERDRYIFILKN